MNHAEIVVNNQESVQGLISMLDFAGDADNKRLLMAAQDAYAHYFLGEVPMVKNPREDVAKVWADVKQLLNKPEAIETVADIEKPKKVAKKKVK